MSRNKALKRNIHGLDFFNEKKDWLIKKQFDFETSQTTYTAKISRYYKGKEMSEFFYDDRLSKNALFTMLSVKKQIKENLHRVPMISPGGIKYCVYNYPKLIPGNVIEDVYEVDINSAYLFAAHKLQLIDEKLFSRMQKINKIDRLKCLGSIATRNVVQVYSKGRITDTHIKTNEDMRRAWFYIVRTIDQILYKFACDYDNFLFYYVDGIYVEGEENVKDIFQQLENFGYNCKMKCDLVLQVGSRGDILVNEPDAEPRFFNTKKTEFKKWITA